MRTPVIAAGTRFLIADALPATDDVTGYAALSWVPIQGIRAMNDLTFAQQTVENRAIGQVPYAMNAGVEIISLLVEMYSLVDAGQSLIKSSANNSTTKSYKIITPDGVVTYFTADAMNRVRGFDTICDTRINLSLRSKILEV